MPASLAQKITHLQFIQRENSIKHHSYKEEVLSYEYIKQGDMKAVTEGVRIFHSDTVGHLSDNPLRNKQYLFIASTTLATRYAIEGGMDAETAYIASDLFIQRADKCETVAEVNDLHKEMLTYYVKQVASHQRKTVLSKPVIQCMDYVYYHLHEEVNGEILAEAGVEITEELAVAIQNAAVPYIVIQTEERNCRVLSNFMVDISAYIEDCDKAELGINELVYYPKLKELMDTYADREELLEAVNSGNEEKVLRFRWRKSREHCTGKIKGQGQRSRYSRQILSP